MPMNTTLLIALGPPVWNPSARLASQSWPMISAAVRLRLKPCLPVEQNPQSSVQPAWLETHRVPRPSSGMKTASTAFAPSTLSSHFRVPSDAVPSPTTTGGSIAAPAASLTRNSLAMSLIAVKSAAPRRWIHFSTWRARKGFSPRLAKYCSMPCASSPRRLVAIALARVQLAVLEEESDLRLGGLRRIRAVHRVGVDRVGEVGADRALGGLLRVGRAHDLAVLGDRVLAFEHLHQHRAGNHEADQVLEERPLAVHRVEFLRLGTRQVHHAGRDDLQAGILEARHYFADRVLLYRVRLDDRKCAFHCHCQCPRQQSLYSLTV